MTLKETQKKFFALNLDPEAFIIAPDDSTSLMQLSIKQAEKDGSIRGIASTYDYHNQMVRDGYNYEGKKLITFSNILKHNTFPLAKILDEVLNQGEKEMGYPVEIEFVMDMKTNVKGHFEFNLLQIRPIASKAESVTITNEQIREKDSIIISRSALGNGVIGGIQDIVYVRPQGFDAANNKATVDMIAEVNDGFLKANRNYILIGPGRWGSADPWLGIPVKWPQISAARLIIESGLENYRIDPSQGTHFFQNLTSFRVGYFTINPFIQDGFYDVEFLDKAEAVYENDTIRHIRFDEPMTIMIDGKNNVGIVLKPGVVFREVAEFTPSGSIRINKPTL
jgi:hypothetical protein